jgi:hypothetical protein
MRVSHYLFLHREDFRNKLVEFHGKYRDSTSGVLVFETEWDEILLRVWMSDNGMNCWLMEEQESK